MSSGRMVASSSPAGERRRLFEILAEQQEPFLLDVYLMENGYTWKSLEKETEAPSTMCLNYARAILCKMVRRSSAIRRLKRNRSGRLVVHERYQRDDSDCKGKSTQIRNVNVLLPGCGSGEGTELISSSYVKEDENIEKERADRWGGLNMEEEDEESKQLSPVSVLELHSDDSDSPPKEHLSGKESSNSLCSKPNSQTMAPNIKQLEFSTKTKSEDDGAKKTQYLHFDLSSSWKRCKDSGDQNIEKIGIEIGDSLFHELIDDLISVLLH